MLLLGGIFERIVWVAFRLVSLTQSTKLLMRTLRKIAFTGLMLRKDCGALGDDGVDLAEST